MAWKPGRSGNPSGKTSRVPVPVRDAIRKMHDNMGMMVERLIFIVNETKDMRLAASCAKFFIEQCNKSMPQDVRVELFGPAGEKMENMSYDEQIALFESAIVSARKKKKIADADGGAN